MFTWTGYVLLLFTLFLNPANYCWFWFWSQQACQQSIVMNWQFQYFCHSPLPPSYGVLIGLFFALHSPITSRNPQHSCCSMVVWHWYYYSPGTHSQLNKSFQIADSATTTSFGRSWEKFLLGRSSGVVHLFSFACCQMVLFVCLGSVTADRAIRYHTGYLISSLNPWSVRMAYLDWLIEHRVILYVNNCIYIHCGRRKGIISLIRNIILAQIVII